MILEVGIDLGCLIIDAESQREISEGVTNNKFKSSKLDFIAEYRI